MGIRRRMAFLVLGMVVCQICTGCGQKVPDSSGAAGLWKAVQGYGKDAGYVSESDGKADGEAVQEIPVTQAQEVAQKPEEPGMVPVMTQAPGDVQLPGMEGSDTITMVTQSPMEKTTSGAPMLTQVPVVTQSGEEEGSMSPEMTQTSVETQQSAGKESVPSGTQWPAEKESVPAVTQQPAGKENVPTATQEPVEREPVVTPVITQAPMVSQPTTKPEATMAPVASPAPTVHTHTLVTETKEASCLTEGVRREYCGTCGEVVSEEAIPAMGHDFVKSVWELPTCMKGGYYNNICNRCGQVECVTQEPLPHEVEDILVQEGNCMEDTVIQHICRMCGIKVKSDTRYTPYDIHSWTVTVVDGTEITYCERCGVAR